MLSNQILNIVALFLISYSIAVSPVNAQNATDDTTATPTQVNSTSNGSSNGQTTTPNPLPPGAQLVTNPDGSQTVVQTVYCPSPDQLTKEGLFWRGTAGWKSYTESFDSSVTGFTGAQWVGINVGRMICIYRGNLAMSFPINVQNDTLAIAPTGASWGSDLGGYRNCHSNNPMDCPFVVKTPSVNMQQIYKGLDFFKGKPNPLQNNN